MTSLREVAAMVRRHGTVIVSPEFLGADGAATLGLGPQLVADLMVNTVGLAYQQIGDEKVRWQAGHHVVRDGEALVVLGDLRFSRLVIEPLRVGEQRVRADASRRPGGDRKLLREMLDDLAAGRRVIRRRARSPRAFQASWHARLNGAGVLDTCGAAVLGGRRLVYASLEGGAMRDLRADFAERHRRRPTADLFAELIGTGNGQTNEWSRPFTLAAPSVEVAAARVVTRLRFRDDLAGHLRELWLAGAPDAAEDCASEAEAIVDGRPLDARAATYLDRLRAAAIRTRAGIHRAASRSTRGGASRGRPRGGGARAS